MFSNKVASDGDSSRQTFERVNGRARYSCLSHDRPVLFSRVCTMGPWAVAGTPGVASTGLLQTMSTHKAKTPSSSTSTRRRPGRGLRGQTAAAAALALFSLSNGTATSRRQAHAMLLPSSSSMATSLRAVHSRQLAAHLSLQQSSSDEVTLTEYPSHLKHKIASSAAKSERRAEERSAHARPLCTGCNRPPSLCVCDALPALDGRPAGTGTDIQSGERYKLSTRRTDILILQHPNEFRKRHFSTVPLISLVLHNVTVKVGYDFDDDDGDDVLTSLGILPLEGIGNPQKNKPLLLFPGEGAIDLDDIAQQQQQYSIWNDDVAGDDGADSADEVTQKRCSTITTQSAGIDRWHLGRSQENGAQFTRLAGTVSDGSVPFFIFFF